ncbi:MAG TPA: hypothetical protein VGI95_17500 [Caulobacteraceae bacterium]|jgi:hypothetical protein
MPRFALALAAMITAAWVLAGCKAQIEPPGDAGVCYHLAAMENGKPRFNVLAKGVADMEHCAASLEAMRTHFLSLGGTHQDIVGAYQANFLFLGSDGVFTAQTYDGPRYPFLVRSGDQLVPVGSNPS